MLELQADCYAGVWARDAAPRLNITQADIDEGLRAATAIGDDTLQRATAGPRRAGCVHARHVRSSAAAG